MLRRVKAAAAPLRSAVLVASLLAALTRRARGAAWLSLSRKRGGERETVLMLRIYREVVVVLETLHPLIERIEERDASLGDQLRRCLSSVALNTSEGGGSQKRNVRARYFNALGSIREVRACLDVACAWRYIEPVDANLADRMDHITAVLWKLTH